MIESKAPIQTEFEARQLLISTTRNLALSPGNCAVFCHATAHDD